MSLNKLNLLVAYPYLNSEVVALIKENEDRIRFVLDSGAFTAWKAGKTIEIDDYCRFIESLPFKPWRYFTLDVVGDPHGTIKNYEIMLARGFNPIPIFTRGEDPSVLDHYYRTSDVVGIGGLVGTRGNKGFVKGIMKKVDGRKCHWLGFVQLPFIRYYKPYMCDSSSWTAGARYGRMLIYKGNGTIITVTKKDIFDRTKRESLKIFFQRLGYDIDIFLHQKSWEGTTFTPLREIGGVSAIHFSQDVYKKLGTYLFLASAMPAETQILIQQHKRIKQ